MTNKNNYGFMSVQWHITSRCGNHCRHCYMYDSTRYETELKNECSFETLVKILDEIEIFEKKWGFKINDFFITGGDPLIREDCFDLFQILQSRSKKIHVMGCPETLTAKNLGLLQSAGVKRFQMSLDGLQETHDYYRGSGSFERTVNALKFLEEYDIQGSIMFTLTDENYSELVPLLDFVACETKAKGFAFDLVCGTGNAKDAPLKLDNHALKEVFELFLQKKIQIKNSGNHIKIGEKSNFFRLIHYDNDEFYPYDNEEFSVASGCYVGYTCYTILSDGSIAACRRFPTIVGKMPEQKMEEIFLENSLLKKFRRASSFSSCGACRLYKYCRGCPAVTFGLTQDPFSPNPSCFKSLSNKTVNEYINPSRDFNTTKTEEANLIKSHLMNQYASDYDSFSLNEDVLILIGTLLNSKAERKAFFHNPDLYVRSNSYNIQSKFIAYVCYYIDSVLHNKIPNPIKYALDV